MIRAINDQWALAIAVVALVAAVAAWLWTRRT